MTGTQGGPAGRTFRNRADTFLRPPDRRHLLSRRFVIAVASLVGAWVVYVFVFSDYGLYNYLALKRERAELAQRIDGARTRREALVRERAALESDNAAIERVGREKYFLGREDEMTFIFVPVDSSGAPVREAPRLPGAATSGSSARTPAR